MKPPLPDLPLWTTHQPPHCLPLCWWLPEVCHLPWPCPVSSPRRASGTYGSCWWTLSRWTSWQRVTWPRRCRWRQRWRQSCSSTERWTSLAPRPRCPVAAWCVARYGESRTETCTPLGCGSWWPRPWWGWYLRCRQWPQSHWSSREDRRRSQSPGEFWLCFVSNPVKQKKTLNVKHNQTEFIS